jgi:hypothetical protein
MAEAGEAARRARVFSDAARLAMRSVLRPLARRGRARRVLGRPPGRRLLVVQIDGLSRPRLEAALRAGRMPFLASMLEDGSHALSPLRTGAPSSTPAFQAGLLHGVSPSVPGYSWVDRATGREVRMDSAADARKVQAAFDRPGLARGGSSYFTIFTGGAALPHFSLSGLAGDLELEWYAEHLDGWDVAASALAHSVTIGRAALRLAAELGAGVADGVRWSAALRDARHEPRLLAHRLLISGLLRELAVQGILLDLSRGLPFVYVDFLSHDELSHRRGPDSPGALAKLGSIDTALASIVTAARHAPRPGYDVYLLSDHGHVATRPFEALTGLSLPDFVLAAARGEPLPEAADEPRRGGRRGTGRSLRTPREAGVAVAEAGDLAHVYFSGGPGPLPLEAVRARHRRVLEGLTRCGAVGLVAVRGGRAGFAIAGGRPDEVLDLADPRDVARLRHPEPALAATYLRDLLSLPDAGDLVVQGFRGEKREVVAYAWEFGSHGGIAPEELSAFVVHPAGCTFPFAQVVRPSELYAFFDATYRRAGAPGREETGDVALPSGAGAAAAAPAGPP